MCAARPRLFPSASASATLETYREDLLPVARRMRASADGEEPTVAAAAHDHAAIVYAGEHGPEGNRTASRSCYQPAMPTAQPGILEPHAPVARSLSFRIAPETDFAAALRRLRDRFPVAAGVVGLGLPAVLALGKSIAGLRAFPALAGPGCSVPSTQQALWFLLPGPDRGTPSDASRVLRALLADSFIAEDAMDLFHYAGGRELNRFEDGTEKP